MTINTRDSEKLLIVGVNKHNPTSKAKRVINSEHSSKEFKYVNWYGLTFVWKNIKATIKINKI